MVLFDLQAAGELGRPIVKGELHVREPQPSMKHLSIVESSTRPISVTVLSPEPDDSVVDSGSGEPHGGCHKATL